MSSIRSRLEQLETAAGREADDGSRCPHCRAAYALIDRDTEDGPAFCFFCGNEVPAPVGRPIKVMIGVRGCL